MFPSTIEEGGTVMGFVDDEFVSVIKDEVQTDEECQIMKHNPLTLDFVCKHDIAVFLLTLEDAVDTNDSILNVYNNEYPERLYRSSESGDGYDTTLYLINSMNTVRVKRRVRLSRGMSNTTSQYFAKQKQAPFMEEELSCSLQGLRSAWEPFGMRKVALGNEALE